jgi:uncharacterized membrane protein YjjB (DUF3815 family)
MGNGEQSGSGGQPNLLAMLGGAVGGGGGVALGWLVVFLAGLSGFWPGMIATVLGGTIGSVLGQLAGRLWSRRQPA